MTSQSPFPRGSLDSFSSTNDAAEEILRNIDARDAEEDRKELQIIGRLGDNDVLVANAAERDRRADFHPANPRLLEIVQDYAQEYNDASNGSEKLAIANQVIDVFGARFPHSRFVQTQTDGSHVMLSKSDILRMVIQELEQAGASSINRRSTRKRKSIHRFDEQVFAKSRRGASSNKDDEDESMERQDSEEETANDDKEEPDSIRTLHKNDVLSANVNFDHYGNLRFQAMLDEYRMPYQKASSKEDRLEVVKNMISAFQTKYPGGRFLKRLDNGSYEEILEGSIVQKVSRGLQRGMAASREKSPPKPVRVMKESSVVEMRSTRKRHRLTRLQDEHEAAVATQASKTAPGKLKRTSSRANKKQVSPPTPSTVPKSTPSCTAKARVSPRKPAQVHQRNLRPRMATKQVSPSTPATVPQRNLRPRKVVKQVTPAPLPRVMPRRVSPDTVPSSRGRTSSVSLESSKRGVSPIPMEQKQPVVSGTNSKPHGLGQLVQKFTEFVKCTNPNRIDLDEAVVYMKIPKRRIYDIINCLDGAGVLERNEYPKNTFRWVAPLSRSPEQLQKALEAEEEQLDTWIEFLENRKNNGVILGRDLAPLMENDTNLLVVHLPKDSVIRTVQAPLEEKESFGFKLTMPARKGRKRAKVVPKVGLLEDDAYMRPIDLSPRTPPPPEPVYVPPSYPQGSPLSPPGEHYHPNPLEILLQVLPKPPYMATESYDGAEPSHSAAHRQQEASLQVSDDDEERPLTPFDALLQASALFP